MEKTQVYLPKEELDALRKAAKRSGRSVAELVREAVRKVVLKPSVAGPVAIWDGVPKRTSLDHDSVHDRNIMRQGEPVFADSGAWIALALTRDPLHQAALAGC